VAGGLTNLSKMPGCNVLVIGAQKRTLSGFSTKAIMPHTGFVFYCDIVQRIPPVIILVLQLFYGPLDFVWDYPCEQVPERYNQEGKTSLDLLDQEIVSGSGISWTICKSAPHCRHITMPASHHSVFYRPDVLPSTQPTASKH